MRPRTEDYRHTAAKRLNNPPAGLQNFDRAPTAKVSYQYDPHLDPQLVWASKAEHTSFAVETVSLHTHEQVTAKAIMRALERESDQMSLFSDTQMSLMDAVRFYEHEVGWANRLILGDSLLVMNSLLHRELMGGKVQMIYIDPPYGVRYNSNFQPRIDRREVKDGSDDGLTREPEQIKAYRDTWTLGIHSYLTYMRDRLLLARDMLTESGSIFVQISDENVHYVRSLLSEVFGEQNYCSQIAFKTTSSQTDRNLASVADYILWYAKDRTRMKYRQMFDTKGIEDDVGNRYTRVELPGGARRPLTADERLNPGLLPKGARIYRHDNLTSPRPPGSFPVTLDGVTYTPGRNYWKTNEEGMKRLAAARRLAAPTANSLAYVRFLNDFPCSAISNVWTDTQTGAFTESKIYVVQTNVKVVARCMLMTTDPADLVLDPTCGAGTTAYVAEHWGRRWITCDTSRVALALARRRLMSATYPYYKLAYEAQGIGGGFVYHEVPHVTLKSIAQSVPPEAEKLYDRPQEIKGIVRVAGPFTVDMINAISPAEAVDFEPLSERARKDDIAYRGNGAPTVNDHLAEMTDLLRRDGGINVPGRGRVELEGLGPITSRPGIHAEGALKLNGKPSRAAVAFGPRFGPVTARLLEEAIRAAIGSYDALVVAGFSFDPEVSAFLSKSPPAGLRLFRTQIAPDVLVGDLLKTRRRENLFAVLGEPDYDVRREKDGHVVELKGVDIYDPNKGEVSPGELGEVAAWFLDQDYDGRAFCVNQVFLPAEKGKSFAKLERALKGVVDPDAWDRVSGFISRPFQPGGHKTIAVKVIDVRGHEVVGVRRVGR